MYCTVKNAFFGTKVTFDACHEKTDLKVFVVAIIKEKLAGWGPNNPSLGMTATSEYNLSRRAPARQSFFGYDNDKDLKVCFLVTCVIWQC